VLRILKDPRVGSFGALALVVSVLLRVALLASLDRAAPVALVLAHTLARVGPVWLMVGLPYVTGDDAKSRDVTRARRRSRTRPPVPAPS
jgi:adenosylcobinamide-GDP ribazoletransferase